MIVTLVLASTSPRRIELMRQAGFNVQVESPDADETPKRGESPRTLVARLARAKAISVARKGFRGGASETQLIIAADTIVVAPNGKSILGKPRDIADAKKTLGVLAGKRHSVFTGYCILPVGRDGTPGKPLVRVVGSKVKMRKLSRTDIERYVKTGEPMDKAGSYAAQGIGMVLIEGIQGSYTNVVGLPMCQLLADLEKSFGIPLLPKV
jgi:septum formation protein